MPSKTQQKRKAHDELKIHLKEDDDLVFEDNYEDELEIEQYSGNEDDDQIEIDHDDDEEEKEKRKVYLPGQQLEDEEVLTADQSAYDMLHHMNVEWPCLSFDILRHNYASKPSYPLSCYLAAGSQADVNQQNQIYVMKTSNLHKTRTADSDDEDQDDSDDEIDEDPIVEYKCIPHQGGVNRLRYLTLSLIEKMHATSAGIYLRDNVR